MSKGGGMTMAKENGGQESLGNCFANWIMNSFM
jgi:hypothetical protein